ncbi:MAG: hypothetical protein HKP16_02740 [Xanthomonadales bacterium]|nr:hypothetical protein [Xanthomonadales bacterium]
MVEGQLSRPNQVIPPVMAAIGGLLVLNLTLLKKR